MKKTFRRALACLLTVLMVVCSFPFTVLAAPTNSRQWWVDDGIDAMDIKEEPTYWGFNSPEDPEHQPLGSWMLPFGQPVDMLGPDDIGYEDHREDWKPVLGVTVSGIGRNDDDIATKKAMYNQYYGVDADHDYDTVMAAGNILNPAELKAGQRIAVTLEFGGFDLLLGGQFKGTFDQEYLHAASYTAPPSRQDTWKQINGSSAAAWKSFGDLFHSAAFKTAGANTNDGTFYIYCGSASSMNGEATTSCFLGTGANDPDGARSFGKYGCIAGVVEFEVLKDCDFTEVFHFDTTDSGTIFEPIARQTTAKIDGVANANDGQYNIGGAPDDNAFALWVPIWSNYSKATAPSHTHGFDGAEAVSNNDGTHTFTCNVADCPGGEGSTMSEDCTYASETTEATCGADGKIVYTCTECSYSYETKIPATGNHTEATREENVVAATCTTDGSKDVVTYCSVCDTVLNTETVVLPKLNHAYGAYVSNNDGTHTATCANDASHTDTQDCDYDYAVVTPPTFDEVGTGRYTCKVCSYSYDVEIPVETCNHANTHVVNAKAATCTETGYTGDTFCDDCQKTIATGTVIDALGHDLISADNAVDPTFDAPGKEADTICTRCDYVEEGAVIPALKGYTVTVAATDLGTTTLDGEDATNGVTKKVLVNSTVKLTAAPVEGAEFVGWSVDGKIVSKDADFTATVVANTEYTPVFTITAADTFTVVFVDQYGNVIDTQTVAAGTDIVEPVAPVRIGYTFAGWSLTEAEIDGLTTGATIIAKYNKDVATTYTVTATGCTITVNGVEYADVATDITYNTKVTVTKAGTDYWTINDAEVAYGDTYTFYVGSNVEVVPCVDTSVVAKPTVAAVSVSEVVGTTKYTYLATRTVPTGYTLVSAGYLYGKNINPADMTLDNVGNNGVMATYAATSSAQFSLTVGTKTPGATIYAKAFLVCKDASGNVLEPVYAELQSHTYA